MAIEPDKALTIGEIARRLGCPIHRIEYIIESRHIQPRQRAGIARVFAETDVEYIGSVLRRIEAERGGDADRE